MSKIMENGHGARRSGPVSAGRQSPGAKLALAASLRNTLSETDPTPRTASARRRIRLPGRLLQLVRGSGGRGFRLRRLEAHASARVRPGAAWRFGCSSGCEGGVSQECVDGLVDVVF